MSTPSLPQKRGRPYLDRQAKRHRGYPGPATPTPPPPPPPPLSLPPSLQTIPEDIFLRIITIIQKGTHLRGTVMDTAREAFALAQVSSTILNRYKASLHTIDAAASSERDPSSPQLLRENLPLHIRNLVTLAGSHLRTLRLPRYARNEIGAEIILDVIHHCTNLSHLSFVDGGCIDRDLCKSIFGASLEVVSIEKPRCQVITSLASCPASLQDVNLSYVPLSAINRIIGMLKSRGQSIKRLSLHFDEPSNKKGGKQLIIWNPMMSQLRSFLSSLDLNFRAWLPRLEEIKVTYRWGAQEYEQSCQMCVDDILQRWVGSVTKSVNRLRMVPGAHLPSKLRVISLCGAALMAIPGLLDTAEIRVFFPGFELQYHGRRNQMVNPCFRSFQMTESIEKIDTMALWKATGGIDTLNIGTVEMVQSYYRMRKEIQVMIRNAKNLRKVTVRLALNKTATALQVFKYVRDILIAAPWVTELEINRDIVFYYTDREFIQMLRAMRGLRILHLKTPYESLERTGKDRVSFVIYLPQALRRVAIACKKLEVLYCEWIGKPGVIRSNLRTDAVFWQLRDIDFITMNLFYGVDCTSLKALVITWLHCLGFPEFLAIPNIGN